MLTKKGKYGLKALIHLARDNSGQTALGSEIARANNIPKKFLDAILGELRNHGLIYARKGPGGGYALARSPADITLGEAVRVLDGPFAPLPCASRTAYAPCDDCVSVAECAVRIAMLQVRDAMAEILDNTSLQEMVKESASAKRRRLKALTAAIATDREPVRRRARRARVE